ncbi:MAG: pilus assembly protein [Bifidobacteriaceae bacterium]|jgi:Flp pilus assembly protein TadG|nr:pilus assembly protein [Bifidobacteriaceae bacterium]
MNKLKSNNGSIIVEATFIIPIFLFFAMSFAMLANVIYAQARIQNALADEARELSQYGYLYSYAQNNSATTVLKAVKKLFDQFKYFPGTVPADADPIENSYDPDDPNNKLDTSFYKALDGTYITSPVTAMFMIIGAKNALGNYITTQEARGADQTIAKVYFQSHLKSISTNRDELNIIGLDAVLDKDNREGVKTDKLLNALGVVNGLDGMDFNGSKIFYSPAKGTTSTPADPDYIEGRVKIPDWSKGSTTLVTIRYDYWNMGGTRSSHHGESYAWETPGANNKPAEFYRGLSAYFDDKHSNEDTGHTPPTQAFIDACVNLIANRPDMQESARELGINPADYALVDTEKSSMSEGGFYGFYFNDYWSRLNCKIKESPIMVVVKKNVPATNVKLRVQYEIKPFNYFNLDIKYRIRNEVIGESGTVIDVK